MAVAPPWGARNGETRLAYCSPATASTTTTSATTGTGKTARCFRHTKNATVPQGTTRSFSSLSVSTQALLGLPARYLRESDTAQFDPHTHQRVNVIFDPINGKVIPSIHDRTCIKPVIAHYHLDHSSSTWIVTWKDGLISTYSASWIEQQYQQWIARSDYRITNDRVHWANLTEDHVRTSISIPFNDCLERDGNEQALRLLYKYGILLITDTPITDDGVGIAALASALGGGSIKNETSLLHSYRAGSKDIVLPHGTDGPMRTLYSTVWSTIQHNQVVGSSTADTAYGCDALPLHTDMTYHRDPPGLQIFTMAQPATAGGGATILADGFAVADRLRAKYPNAFHVLSCTMRTYRCIDPTTGWHLEAAGPVFSVAPNNNHHHELGQVLAIRHNDLDRMPDLPARPVNEDDNRDHTYDSAVDCFYADLAEAHHALDSILCQEDIRLVLQLQPSETIVVANQRILHGRSAFEPPRCILGCYVSQDELNSRFRMLGLSMC